MTCVLKDIIEWMELMKELGYERLAVQGGDWGADVTTLLGLRHPERVIGIHLNSIPPYKPYLEAGTVLSEVEQAFLNEAIRWYEKSGAYDHIQKTAPQTVAYGLTDSPAGLTAWILEKFRDWGDCDGDIERRFTKDELLSNICPRCDMCLLQIQWGGLRNRIREEREQSHQTRRLSLRRSLRGQPTWELLSAFPETNPASHG